MIHTDGRPTIAWAPEDLLQARRAPEQDIVVRNEGSIVLLCPKTPTAESWLEEHLDPDALMYGPAYCVEPRYVAPIVEGAIEDGLKIGMTP